VRLSELPPQASLERAEAERHGVRGIIVLPLLFGRRVLGAIGFHAVRSELEWEGEREAILRIAGEMIVGVLQHRRARDQLAEQSRSLEESVVALEKTNAELQQFAHVASHDLQEPLRSISSFSSLLSERYLGRLDASADEYLGYLRNAANRMHELVTGLLGYSGMSRAGSVFEPLATGEVLNAALANLKPEMEHSGAEILTGKMPAVLGDRGQLALVFQHLLENALKFRGPMEPRITVAAERAAEFWEFSVKDNGIGIEPRHFDRIFQPFARLHAAGKYAGTGIGLAICRRVIERHGGRLWVESDGARGSTFKFTLPALDERLL
jgi:light-regulated signal transduction histidine kinase (bacteriophytochrome)